MMKKFLLLLIFAISATTFISAQNDMYLSWDGKKLGDTVYVWGEPTQSQIIFYAVLHNDTDNDMNVLAVKNELEMLDSTISTFCWAGRCYAPTVDTSTNYQFVPAGGASAEGDFTGDYEPRTKIGTSIVKYTFYNMDNPDQRVEIVVKFWASPESIAEEAMNGGSVSEIYPNPANHFINLDYRLTTQVNTAQVRIYNMLGATVKEAVMERGTNNLKMDVSDLNNGIYFYSVVINGDIYKTKKIVIQR